VLNEPARWSLGWRSELIQAGVESEIRDHHDHWAVRTPRSPLFYWGNFLLFDRAPSDVDFEPWMRRFEQEVVAGDERIGHVAFGLDVPQAEVVLPQSFAQAGFELFGSTVMTLEPGALQDPPPAKAQARWRPLRWPDEVPAVIDLQCACNEQGYEATGFRAYREDRMRLVQALRERGQGEWFVAELEGQFVANCGLVLEPPGTNGRIARFQHVETHPAHRRLGLCRQLIHTVCRHAFQHSDADRLVMCADPEDVAIGIYHSLGFVPQGRLWHLQRRRPEDRR
jgi:RimJ/RimL family protein N-acetyltransferase